MRHGKLKHTVATVVASVMFFLPAQAQVTRDLLDALRDAPVEEAPRIAADIAREWSRSGSASMDLLLKRGRDALEVGEVEAAIEHLTALTDHAPDFAEGFVTRAMAYASAGLIGPAVADLETALTLNPQHFEAIKGLGLILESLGSVKLAWRAYEQAASLYPSDPELAAAFERLGPAVRGTDL
jgi:tetratricopeptide (TPR) repeat protein